MYDNVTILRSDVCRCNTNGGPLYKTIEKGSNRKE